MPGPGWGLARGLGDLAQVLMRSCSEGSFPMETLEKTRSSWYAEAVHQSAVDWPIHAGIARNHDMDGSPAR